MRLGSAHVDTFVRDNLPPRDMWPELSFALPGLRFPETYNASSMLDARSPTVLATTPAVYSAAGDNHPIRPAPRK